MQNFGFSDRYPLATIDNLWYLLLIQNVASKAPRLKDLENIIGRT